MDIKEKILTELKPLFEEARSYKLWFRSKSGKWFSPQELKLCQKKGHYLWGKSQWDLRDPYDYLDELEQKKQQLEAEIKRVKEQLNK